MCCMFTCLAWFLDFLQQAWTFLMSFCVMSALCFLFVVASSAGVVMGYNYSLSEFIDTKETNISVHMKRGIFEQDASLEEDLAWRRSGNEPVNAARRTQATVQPNIAATPVLRQQEPEQPVISRRSGRLPIRKIEDSIFETDDRHQFEGSLLKLTSKSDTGGKYGAVNLATHTQTTRTEDMNEILSEINPNSADHLKGVQSYINRKRINALTQNQGKTPTSTHVPVEKFIDPGFSGNVEQMVPIDGGRRMMVSSQTVSTLFPVEKMRPNVDMLPTKGESLREYVPGPGIGDPAKWFLPKVPPAVHSDIMRSEYKDEEAALNAPPTFPLPVTPRHGPLKPSRHRPTVPTTTTVSTSTETKSKKIEQMDDFAKPFANQDNFENPILFEKMDQNADDMRKHEKDYYEDDMKGLPIRRRRNVDPLKDFLLINQINTAAYNLKGKYTSKSAQMNMESIVTAKNLVIATNSQKKSSSLSFMEDVK